MTRKHAGDDDDASPAPGARRVTRASQQPPKKVANASARVKPQKAPQEPRSSQKNGRSQKVPQSQPAPAEEPMTDGQIELLGEKLWAGMLTNWRNHFAKNTSWPKRKVASWPQDKKEAFDMIAVQRHELEKLSDDDLFALLKESCAPDAEEEEAPAPQEFVPEPEQDPDDVAYASAGEDDGVPRGGTPSESGFEEEAPADEGETSADQDASDDDVVLTAKPRLSKGRRGSGKRAPSTDVELQEAVNVLKGFSSRAKAGDPIELSSSARARKRRGGRKSALQADLEDAEARALADDERGRAISRSQPNPARDKGKQPLRRHSADGRGDPGRGELSKRAPHRDIMDALTPPPTARAGPSGVRADSPAVPMRRARDESPLAPRKAPRMSGAPRRGAEPDYYDKPEDCSHGTDDRARRPEADAPRRQEHGDAGRGANVQAHARDAPRAGPGPAPVLLKPKFVGGVAPLRDKQAHANSFEEPVRSLIIRTQKRYGGFILTVCAFPSQNQKDDWANALWTRECESCGLPYRATKLVVKLICIYGSNARSCLLRSVRLHVPAQYSLCSPVVKGQKPLKGKELEEYIADRVKKALTNWRWMCKDIRSRGKFCENAIVYDVVKACYFRTANDSGVRHDWEYGPFTDNTFALIFTLVEYCLQEEWATGAPAPKLKAFSEAGWGTWFAVCLKNIQDTFADHQEWLAARGAMLHRKARASTGAADVVDVGAQLFNDDDRARVHQDLVGRSGWTDLEAEEEGEQGAPT